MPPTPAPIDDVCILRLSALGDATHTVPVIRAIQRHWPKTRISWIIGKPEHALLHNLEGVEFLVFDKRGGWRAVRELRRKLAGRRFDALLHMQVAARSNLLSTLVRAPVRIGWDRGRSRDGHRWFVNRPVPAARFQHQLEGFLSFAETLGLPPEPPRWDLPVAEADRAWAAEQLPGEGPWLAISPCSSHPARNWRAERYATVADHAAGEHGLRVALLGGPSPLERSMADAITAAARTDIVDLVGKDTLPQSLALLERAALVISPDSGPAHIASALGTPVIGLYASSWARRSGPYNSPALTVDRFPDAARAFRGREPEDLRWGTRIEDAGVMDLVTVEDVLERLERWRETQAARVSVTGNGATASPIR